MITVVIPVYNGESYIARCLDSLLAQECENLEIIAVNDGSQDASSALLHQYADKYPSLRVVDKENAGASQARKTGVDLAKGDYVGFMDIDDCAEPGWYQQMEEKAVQTHADIVVCNYTECSTNGRFHTVKNQFDEGQTFPMTPEETMSYLHRRKAYFPFPWNKIYRTELLRAIQFPTENFVGEDYNMHLQLLHNGAKVEFLDVAGYRYMITENSVSRRGFGPASVRTYQHFQQDYEWICQNHPEQKQNAVHYLMTEYLALIIAMGRNKNYDRSMIAEIKDFVRKGLKTFLKSEDVSQTMKLSALAFMIHHRLLIAAYRLVKS